MDIKTSDAKFDANLNLKSLSMNYSEEKELEIVNTGHSVMAKIQETSGKTLTSQSELPWPIPLNSVESDHGCTSRIYFDKAGNKVTLTVCNVTLTSQKPFYTITSLIAATQTA